MRRLVAIVFALTVVCILAVAVLTYGCQQTRSASNTGMPKWSTDTAKLGAAVPIFHEIDRASWTVVKVKDRDAGLVPGPSAYATLGYARVDSATIRELVASGTRRDDGAVMRDVEQHLSDIGAPVSGHTWLRVENVDRLLAGKTKFQDGEMLIDESAQIIYFQFVAD